MDNELGLSELPESILNWIDHNSQNMIGVWDCQMKLVFVTKSVVNILGYHPVELLGDKWRKLFSEDEQNQLYKNLSVTKEKNIFVFLLLTI